MDLLLGVLAGLAMAFVLFNILFETWDEFLECLKYWIKPDILSMIRGEYWEDNWAELKLVIWASGSVAVGVGVYNWA